MWNLSSVLRSSASAEDALCAVVIQFVTFLFAGVSDVSLWETELVQYFDIGIRKSSVYCTYIYFLN